MKKAIECFNSKKFIESKNLFLKELLKPLSNDDKISIYKKLLKIDSILNIKSSYEYANTLLSLLFSEKEYQAYVDYYQDTEVIKFENRKNYFEALYLCGELDKSLGDAKKLTTYMIENKIYNHIESYIKNVESYFKGYLFYEFAHLIYNLETNNLENAKHDILRITEKITSSWSLIVEKRKSQIEYIIHLIAIVEGFGVTEYTFCKSFLLMKCKLSRSYPELEISKKEILEVIITYQNEKDEYYLLTEIIKDEFIGYDLLDYLRKNNIKDIKAYKKKKVKITDRYIKDKEAMPVIEKSDKYLYSREQSDHQSVSVEGLLEKYNIELEKKEYFSYTKSEIELLSEESKIEVILSAISLEDYEFALELTALLPEAKKLKYNYLIFKESGREIENIAYLSELLIREDSRIKRTEILSYLTLIYRERGESIKAENVEALVNGMDLSSEKLIKAFTDE